MKILESKKQIINDWQHKFTQLSIYSPVKLYGILDIAIIGIELINVSAMYGEYRPYIVCYPLWKVSNKDNLSGNIILQEVCDKKGLQFDIPYVRHQFELEEVAECTREQACCCLEGTVSVESILNLINFQFSNLSSI